jgi:hypothetical protein
MYDDVTLNTKRECVWWCDTSSHVVWHHHADVTLCMMTWHYVWWCDCMMMWHCVWWCDPMKLSGALCARWSCILIWHVSSSLIWHVSSSSLCASWSSILPLVRMLILYSDFEFFFRSRTYLLCLHCPQMPLNPHSSAPVAFLKGYDDVTLCMMMWHYVWWCDTTYDDLTLCMMMWHTQLRQSPSEKDLLRIHSVTSSYTVSHHHTQCHIIIHSVTSSYTVSHHHT